MGKGMAKVDRALGPTDEQRASEINICTISMVGVVCEAWAIWDGDANTTHLD